MDKNRLGCFGSVFALLALIVLWWLLDIEDSSRDGTQWFYGYEILDDGTLRPPDTADAGFDDPGPIEFPDGYDENWSPVVGGLLDGDEGAFDAPLEFPPYEGEIIRDDGWGFGPECLVTDARVIYNGNANAPLTFPVEKRSPAPGATSVASKTGPSVGPMPGLPPQMHRIGNNFEYHSDLNGVHGCTSRQFVTSFNANLLVAFAAAASADLRPARPDDDAAYLGTTTTGKRQFPTGETYYEGTENVIHWLDAPALKFIPNHNRRNFATVVVQLLKSVTYDGNGTTGMLCLTGHTYIAHDNTGAPMAPKDAQTLLQNLNPVGGNNAASTLRQVTSLLNTPEDKGGYKGRANPEFRDLGCYPF